MPRPSPLIDAVAAPPIPEARAWTQRYDGRYGPLIDLSQAVPGTPPHPALRGRMAEMAGSAEGARYGAIQGDAELRAALADEVAQRYGGDVVAGDVAITAGCNQAFVSTMIAIAPAGSAVVLPAPWYFNHKMTLDMLGIATRPLVLDAENGFVPDPEQIGRLIDGDVRAIVLVTPNNPTGAIYPANVISEIMDIARRRDVWLIIDETYRDFIDDRTAPHALFAAPDWRRRLIHLYSFSKSYCIPGHRLGAAVAGPDIIEALVKVQDSLQISAPRTAQQPVAWAMTALADWREDGRRQIAARAATFTAAMQALPDWRIDAIGAYFAYVRHPFARRDGAEIARRLASEAGILVLPGSYFGPGQDGHLRFAFANADPSHIADIPRRLAAWRDSAPAMRT
ncbi:MAG: aminotransferase [Hyphomicrobiaceae bacterium]